MKHSGKTTAKDSIIALALTWDGARWPVRMLPPKARAFLAGKSRDASAPPPKTLTKLFAEGRIREIRICWVPRLKGGAAVLSEPFSTPAGKRIAFQSVKTLRFGDTLGVIYRKG